MYFVLYFIIVIFYVFFIQHSMLLNLNVSYRKYIYVILVWYVWYVCPTLYEEWDAVPLTCQWRHIMPVIVKIDLWTRVSNNKVFTMHKRKLNILQRIAEEVWHAISECIQQAARHLNWTVTCLNNYAANWYWVRQLDILWHKQLQIQSVEITNTPANQSNWNCCLPRH